jgi:hypothetical protein
LTTIFVKTAEPLERSVPAAAVVLLCEARDRRVRWRSLAMG